MTPPTSQPLRLRGSSAMIESLVPEICESEAWAAFAGA
jgi:hypothetical protein